MTSIPPKITFSGIRSLLSRMARRYGVVLLFLAVYLTVSYFFTGSPCVFRLLTGVPCPGCGLTRAFFALFRFDFGQAFFFHPFIFLLIPIAVFILVEGGIRGKPLKKYYPLFIAAAACFFLLYILRMICLFPGDQPMAYDRSSILGRILEARGFFNTP